MPTYSFICVFNHLHDRNIPFGAAPTMMVCPACGYTVVRKFVAPALRFYLSPDEFMTDHAGKFIKPKDYDTADRKAVLKAEGREHLI